MAATVLSILAILATIGVIAHAVADSRRHGRVTPTFYLVVAFGSAAWLEPFYDWGLYATFSDDWVRSDAGFLHLAGNGLPLAALPLYAVYFFLAGTAGVALTQRLLPRLGLPRPVALLLVGYAVGFCFDLTVELTLPRLDLYEFTHVARGWVPFAETSNQLPLGMPLGMATIIAGATYLIGLSDGQLVTERWARALSRTRPTLTTFVVTTVAFNLFMGVAVFQYLITRWAGWNTVVIPDYGASSDGGSHATLFFVGWNAIALGSMVLAAHRWDWSGRRPATPVAITPPLTNATRA